MGPNIGILINDLLEYQFVNPNATKEDAIDYIKNIDLNELIHKRRKS
jgi:hypothetical protein